MNLGFCSTPLGWAAKFGQLQMSRLLLSRGAKSNLPDDPLWATPPAWATRRGHGEINRAERNEIVIAIFAGTDSVQEKRNRG